MDFRVAEDIELVKHLRGCTVQELADSCGTTPMSFSRWARGAVQPSHELLDSFYNDAFNRGIHLNQIKAQLYEEDLPPGKLLLFHGSKSRIDGPLKTDASRLNNDFGQGFYCGERLDQAAMFVHGFPRSCLYMLSASTAGLKGVRFTVDQDWMLSIALFRGRLNAYADHPRLLELKARVLCADFVVAPIADNRMYEVVDSFIDGELTDEQCRHCLSATNLGSQYVLRTQRSIERTSLLECCFLCSAEKRHYGALRIESSRSGPNKAKAARRLYRGVGQYIEEVLA